MQHPVPACQLERANDADSRQKSTPKVGTQCLNIAPACQWLTTTEGRIALDGHSWMTAVHWVHDSGLYTPTRTHGPRGMNHTTLLIAQECANLKTCRPGIAYLARKAKVSERTVEYHLGMLREAGLLAYRSKGGRVVQGRDEASVYERTIPTVFDDALGIRTTGEGVQRRPVGASDTHRKTLGKLARKAARKVRRPRRRTPVSGDSRCTLMEGGSAGLSSAGSSIPPSETRLASGSHTHPTPKKALRGPQKLNKIGRRHQLARQLIDNVPWLSRASAPRIAWIARHCADAGWKWQEVQAAAEENSPIDPADSRRPSGLLAYRLKGVHQLYKSTKARHLMFTAWEDSRAQELFRRTGFDQPAPEADSPAALDARQSLTASRNQEQADWAAEQDGPMVAEGIVDIRSLSRKEVLEQRELAAADPTFVRSFIAEIGELNTRRLLTSVLVDQALTLLRLNPEPALTNAF